MQARRDRKWDVGFIILDKMTRKGATETAVPEQRPEGREEREPGACEEGSWKKSSRASTLRQEPVLVVVGPQTGWCC